MFAPIMDLRGLTGVGPRVAEHTINSIPYTPARPSRISGSRGSEGGAAIEKQLVSGGRIMAQSYTTMVGTVGTGIWTSNDGGERWTRCRGMWNETQVFALTPHPQNPQVVFAGAHDGIYRSDDGGVTFESIASPSAARPSGPWRLIRCSPIRCSPERAGRGLSLA